MTPRTILARTRWGLPLAILVIGVTLSIAMAVAVRQEIARNASERFDAGAADLALKVENRFDDYIAVLTGLRARFNTGRAVTREDFRDFVAGLDLARNYPGFQAITYAPYVPGADKERFEAEARRDPGLDAALASSFAIKPAGNREDYYPILFIEPLAGNERLLGSDLAAMPNRGNALEQARDTGALISSGRKIRIAGRDTDVGLAMRLPVYRAHMPLDTVEQRRAAYQGSVGSGFSVSQMMRDIASRQQHGPRFRLYDAGQSERAVGSRIESRFVGSRSWEEKLLFDSSAAAVTGSPASAAASGGARAAPAQAGLLERTLAFELGGRSWVIEVVASESELVGRLDRAVPWLIALAGMAISSLLAAIVYWLITTRGRAQVLAANMTRHLRSSERQLEQAQRIATLGSWVLDTHTLQLQCSDEARRILGLDAGPPPPDLANLLSRVPLEARGDVQARIAEATTSGERREFEHPLCLPDGTQRWVHVIVQRSEEDGRARLHGTVRDDTVRRKGALRLRLEHEVARLLVGDGEPTAVFEQAISAACAQLHWDCAALWYVHDDEAVKCLAAWHAGTDPALRQFIDITRSIEYRRDEGPMGRAWLTGDVVQVDNLRDRTDFTRDALAGEAGMSTGLVIPAAIGQTTLALEVFSRDPIVHDEETVESLRVIALLLAQYAQRKRAEHGLRFVATHDSLTGLYNRAALERELRRAIRRSNRHRRRFAVMFIDLDRFKQINDTLGHGVGDQMLAVCAERLRALVRADDSVARFGGDEFVLLVENLSGVGDVTQLADRALGCVTEPFLLDGHELHMSASIGVSVYPEDGTDPESLLKNADTAMYRAKDLGRGTHRFYAAQMNAQASERLLLEGGLRRAVERRELELHYQPKMDLKTRRIVGVEALMRWRHPTLGMVSPAQFIPIAEETGAIAHMGRWALEEACAKAIEWRSRGLPPVQMSVNLSPRQLTSRELVSDIAAILGSCGLDPSLLELEITEGAMMKNPDHAVALLKQIRDLGVGLAMDDFGTGYSSLSYLRRFPLSTVKIDRSFIKDIPHDADAKALVDGIVTLAHGLRMKVVAEGVEAVEQVHDLAVRGCDQIQGYWLSRPIPADEACEFMAQHLRHQFVAAVAV